MQQNKIKIKQQFKKAIQEIEEENIKELLMGGGGGGICYFMGYMEGLIEIVGKEKLREYKLGGVSCGSIMAMILHLLINSDLYTMNDMFKLLVHPMCHSSNRRYFGFLTSGKVVNSNVDRFIQILKNNPQIPSFKDTFHCISSELRFPILKPKILDNFENYSQIKEAIRSSCAFPFFLEFGIFQKFKGKRMLDGGFTRTIPYKYKYSQKIYLHVLPPSFVDNPFFSPPKNTKIIYISKGANLNFPYDYVVGDLQWAEKQKDLGYQQAYKHIDILLKYFELKQPGNNAMQNSILPSL